MSISLLFVFLDVTRPTPTPRPLTVARHQDSGHVAVGIQGDLGAGDVLCGVEGSGGGVVGAEVRDGAVEPEGVGAIDAGDEGGG